VSGAGSVWHTIQRLGEKQSESCLPVWVSGDSRGELVSPAASLAGLISDSGGELDSFIMPFAFGSCWTWPANARRRWMYFCKVGYIWL
jgi:hypothetical protein